jgi:hypothetical protein
MHFHMWLSYKQEIIQIVEAMDQINLTQLQIKDQCIEIHMN